MRAVTVYNTLTRKKELFQPLNSPNIKMYVCGPTVYDFLHVGNFRGPVVFNLIRNFLEKVGYKVTFALNFTDVDDKIIKRANELGISATKLSETYIFEYKQDFKILGLRPHDLNPKVSEHLPDIQRMIQALIEKGKAYITNGDVWFSIESFKDYGKLSGRKTDELLAGARVDVDETKRNPLDFALWKSAKPGEPWWESPWGKGRPGWHIECSAMNQALFGDQIDIHGGGTDLMFPHHENEIAQSEGCSHQTFSKYWIHWQMLNFSGQKMSKSVGNIISLREFVEKYHPEVYKFMILSVHYRSIAEFSEEVVNRSIASLAKIYSALATADSFLEKTDCGELSNSVSIGAFQSQWDKVLDVLSDDFNTAEMMALVYEVVRIFNQSVKRGMKVNSGLKQKCLDLKTFFIQLNTLTALFGEDSKSFLKFLDDLLIRFYQIDKAKVTELVELRARARAEKDFAKSDEIRAVLTSMKISVSDLPNETYWEVIKN